MALLPLHLERADVELVKVVGGGERVDRRDVFPYCAPYTSYDVLGGSVVVAEMTNGNWTFRFEESSVRMRVRMAPDRYRGEKVGSNLLQRLPAMQHSPTSRLRSPNRPLALDGSRQDTKSFRNLLDFQWSLKQDSQYSQTQIFDRFRLVMTSTFFSARAIGIAQQTIRGTARPFVPMFEGVGGGGMRSRIKGSSA